MFPDTRLCLQPNFKNGWDMDAPAERMGSGWTLSWLGHGRSGRTDGVLGERCHGWDMDALTERNGWGLGGRYHDGCSGRTERMGSGCTLSWLGHGCSGRTDGVWVDVIMLGTWNLAERMGSGRVNAVNLDALWHFVATRNMLYMHTYKHTYMCMSVRAEPRAARKSD